MELRSFATETDGADGESGSFAELEDGQLAITVDVSDGERESSSSASPRRRALGRSKRKGGARFDEDGWKRSGILSEQFTGRATVEGRVRAMLVASRRDWQRCGSRSGRWPQSEA